jgi:hypothetical protein
MIPTARLRLALPVLLALAPARGDEPAPKRTEGDLAMADGARPFQQGGGRFSGNGGQREVRA